MGFYGEISVRYSQEVATQLRRWSTQNSKLASAYNSRIFLLECKRKGLTPKHISSSIKSTIQLLEIEAGRRYNGNVEALNNTITVKIIRAEISHINYKINYLERSM